MKKIGADVNLMTGRNKRILEIFSQRAVIIPPFLDVGAGNSWNRDRLSEMTNFHIYTSEIDLDIEHYAFVDEFFKTIVSFEVLEHLYNPLFHLTELHRVLSSDGVLYLTTPNDYSLIYKAEHLLSKKYRPHFHQFNERDLRDILERAGFEIYSFYKFHRSHTGTLARISRNGLWVSARKIVNGKI